MLFRQVLRVRWRQGGWLLMRLSILKITGGIRRKAGAFLAFDDLAASFYFRIQHALFQVFGEAG